MNLLYFALRHPLYQRWMLLPSLAFILSWVAGPLSIFLFPLLLTIVYYYTLKKHPVVIRPWIWFLTAPITSYIWFRWGPIEQLFSEPHGRVEYGIAAHYAGQLLCSTCLLLMISDELQNAVLRWMGSMLISGAVCLGFYVSMANLSAHFLETGSLTLFITPPLVGLIANGISGLLLIDYEHR
ncbi:hypothetical protein [Spirosoma montaniterrae]|uniref:Uncharacterized protein n=1 Tax=Spirosoma montaniterrae TaxID=1178516 RepID=A0A1P9WRZ3_9BACT|nr:hypothetical protein [Spirosoma montaniterrae]AQG78145.1 hypothetical protein AWR27_01530 [Spirosoma montaniterrae]